MEVDRFPSMQVVAEEFFTTYSRDQYPLSILELQKRPDGWWTVERSLTSEKRFQDQLFWSYQDTVYLPLSYIRSKNDELQVGEYQQVISRAFLRNFDDCIFYGYIGWADDVIATFDQGDKRSDQELYALARAYSAKASDLIHNNSGFSDPKEIKVKGHGPNSLSQEDLATYRKYRHKAIELFEALFHQNDDFETLVGSIGVKAANEYLCSFLDLMVFQNDEEAFKELKKGIYTPFMVDMAKNYLSSCAPNAILFTNGDNDTYPVYYVQAMEGFRTDVTVVNLSLLNTIPYLNRLRKPLFGAKGIDFSIPNEKMGTYTRTYFYIEEVPEKSTSLKKLLKAAVSDKNIEKTVSGDVYFSVPGPKYVFDKGTTFRFKEDYLYRADVMVFDIVSKYMNKRPIYFAVTIGTRAFSGLENHCQIEGLACRLCNKEVKDNLGLGYIENPSLLYDRYFKSFEWAGLETVEYHNLRQARNCRSQLFRLATYSMKNGQQDLAKDVAKKTVALFNNDIVPYDDDAAYAVSILYFVGMVKEAHELARIAILNHLRWIKEHNDDNEKLSAFRKNMNSIIDQVESAGQLTLAKELREMIGAN